MNKQNETIRNIMAHRSIRKYTSEPIAEDIMQTLFAAAGMAPSSVHMQAYSIIRIRDAALREKLGELGGQRCVTDGAELLLFVLDLHRSERLAAGGEEAFTAAGDYYSFQQAMLDTVLAAQNLSLAAESLGIGTVYLGTLTQPAQEVIELLELPQLTFPVVGLSLGWPAEDPEVKPRLPEAAVVFTDRYRDTDTYRELLADYNSQMADYYATRTDNRRVADFTEMVRLRYSGLTLEIGKRNYRALAAQGFTWAVQEARDGE